MIKQITLTLLLSPMALLPTSKPASAPQEQNIQPIPVPLSVRADHRSSADEKENEGKGSDLSSENDVKILFELAHVWSGDDTLVHRNRFENVANFKRSKFFEAIDTHDLRTISLLATEETDFIYAKDNRRIYSALLKTNVAQKLLSLYHESLAAPNRSFAHWGEMQTLTTYIAGSFSYGPPARAEDDHPQINANPVVLRLTQDWAYPPLCGSVTEDTIPWYKLNQRSNNYGLHSILNSHETLTRAAIAGHADIVETLLKALITRMDNIVTPEEAQLFYNRYDTNLSALKALVDCSSIENSSDECQNAAAEIFRNLGLPAVQRYENYPAIAQLLIRTQLQIKEFAARHKLTQQDEQPSATSGLQDVLHGATRHGSAKLFQLIAEESAHTPSEELQPDFLEDAVFETPYERFTLDTVNGEKLGTLLSIDAHPDSMTFQLGMSMLSHVGQNPALLERLKAYIRQCRAIDTEIHDTASAFLLPVLAPFVVQYAHRRMPREIEEYIINLQADHPKMHEDEYPATNDDQDDSDAQNLVE